MVWSFLAFMEVHTYIYKRIRGFHAFSSTLICNKYEV